MASNIIPICKRLLELAEKKYGSIRDPLVSTMDETNDFASKIFELVEETALNLSYPTFDETLDHDEEFENDYEDNENDDLQCSENSSQEWEFETIDDQNYSLDRMTAVVSFYDKCKANKIYQTQQRYRFVTGSSMIHRFRNYVTANGKRAQKLIDVELYTYERFQDARKSLLSVSDRDLRYWAVGKAKVISLEFQASNSWVRNFKKKHKIVSRKITKYTTLKEISEQPQLMLIGQRFVDQVKSECVNVPTRSIWNFDQSGFNYELMYDRTLSTKGEKDTACAVKSQSARTHSHSIMPLVSMDGRLHEKLLVCLQETGGVLGKRVQASLNVPENIFLTCSKSGKLDKSIMKTWIEDSVSPLAAREESFVLIYDSWTGQTDTKLYEGIPNLTKCFKIPPKTTSFTQPLDVYFFRQYRIVRRKLSDRILLDGVEINLHNRDNVVKMHSLIYNQLQSLIFQPMIRYSWYACKYTDNRAGRFMNVNEILFDFTCVECDDDSCEKFAFIHCSYCRHYYCVSHFFINYHYHQVEIKH